MSLPPAQVPSGTVAGEDIKVQIQYIYWGLGGGGGGMDPAGSPTLVVPTISSAQSGVFPIVSGFIRDHIRIGAGGSVSKFNGSIRS